MAELPSDVVDVPGDDQSGTAGQAQPNLPADIVDVPSGPSQTYSSAILPLTRYAGSSMPSWDPHAGILGQLISGATLPGDVATGKVAYGSPEMAQRTAQAAMLAGPRVSPGTATGAVPIPAASTLKAVGKAGYEAATSMEPEVHYTLEGVSNLLHNTTQGLYKDSFNDVTEPKTFALLGRMANVLEGSYAVPLSAIENSRKALFRLAKKYPEENAAATQAANNLEQFMMNPAPEDVHSGDAAQAAQIIREARGNYGAYLRSNKLTTLEEKAEQQEQPTADKLRSYLRRIIDPEHPERLKGYSPQEIQAIKNFAADPSALQRGLGTVARMTGGGHGGVMTGLSAILAEKMLEQGVGADLGPTGMAMAFGGPFVVGKLANKARNALASRAFQNVDELIRSRSPYYQQQAGPPVGPVMQTGRTVLTPSVGIGSIRAQTGPAMRQTEPPPSTPWSLRPGELGA